MSRSRRACFTIHDYDEALLAHLQRQGANCTFMIVGKEVCPTTGRRHLQGYVEFAEAKTFSAVKTFLGERRAHVERAMGSPEQNIQYCSKEGDFFSIGEVSQQGHRSDIHAFVETARTGAPLDTILDLHPVEFCKYSRAYDRICSSITRGRPVEPPDVYWFWGPTGTGKSHTAWELAPDAYRKPPGKWWDGYQGQADIIFDEFRADWFKFHELLGILDKYPIRVEYKGGSTCLMGRRFFITCPYKPGDLFAGQTDERVDQLTRRITTIRHFSVRHVPI